MDKMQLLKAEIEIFGSWNDLHDLWEEGMSLHDAANNIIKFFEEENEPLEIELGDVLDILVNEADRIFHQGEYLNENQLHCLLFNMRISLEQQQNYMYEWEDGTWSEKFEKDYKGKRWKSKINN